MKYALTWRSLAESNTGLIVGVVVGALVLVAATFIGFYFGWKCISKRISADEEEKQAYLGRSS